MPIENKNNKYRTISNYVSTRIRSKVLSRAYEHCVILLMRKLSCADYQFGVRRCLSICRIAFIKLSESFLSFKSISRSHSLSEIAGMILL